MPGNGSLFQLLVKAQHDSGVSGHILLRTKLRRQTHRKHPITKPGGLGHLDTKNGNTEPE
eukprot:2790927-Pleurochrysis_carterae.AAC.1